MLRGKKHRLYQKIPQVGLLIQLFPFQVCMLFFPPFLPFPVSSYILSHSCRSADSLSQTASALDVSQKTAASVK